MIFIRLQAANDVGDLNDLRAFTTPEMFAVVKLDLQERGGVAQRTDVVRVDAEVLDVAREADRQIVSVRFHGMIRKTARSRPRRSTRSGISSSRPMAAASGRSPASSRRQRRSPAPPDAASVRRARRAASAGARGAARQSPAFTRARCRRADTRCRRSLRSRPLPRCCCVTLLGACAPLPSTTPREAADVVAPNRNLVAQGIPPVPRRLVDEVARYTDFRGHRFVDWHPLRSEMLVSTRKAGGDTTQIFRIAAPLAEPEQLTDFSEPVRTASYEPMRGDYIVFERSTGGDEAAQLYRLDLATRQTTLLTPAESAPQHAGVAASLEPAALPLATARSHRSRRQPQRDQPDALADRPAPATGAAAPRRAARRRLGRELGRLGRFADRAHPLPLGRRVRGLAARSRERHTQAGPAGGRAAVGEPSSPASGSGTARAFSSSATEPGSFAS